LSNFLPRVPSAGAAIAPHAGWYYSGKIAAAAVSRLDPGTETIAIIGGHLPSGLPPLFAEEDAVQTPLGDMIIDRELRSAFEKEIGGREDIYQDNTVEVLLPMVRFYLPHAKLLWIRLPAEISSFEAGKTLAALAKKLGRSLAVLGSTDLTHYGDNYDFSPHGKGGKALQWVKETNDRAFISAVEEGKPETVLQRAIKDKSACSAGAVLGALGFARAQGLGKAKLLAYGTSAGAVDNEDTVPDSFVGYASFAFF
jgi:AmmeMemoRadiSam system protein B